MATGLWIQIIVLGGLLGMLGQGARVVVGLKKVQDQATQTGTSFFSTFETRTLVLSIFVGFIAGALAAVAVLEPDAKGDISASTETVLGLAAAGYAGTDFIEAFMKRHLAPASSAVPPGISAGGTAAGGGQPPAFG